VLEVDAVDDDAMLEYELLALLELLILLTTLLTVAMALDVNVDEALVLDGRRVRVETGLSVT
jgi:hypothetical protein